MLENIFFTLRLFIAFYLIVSTLYISKTILDLFNKAYEVGIRLLFHILFVLWLATIFFFILTSFGAFNLKTILLCNLILVAIIRMVFRLPFKLFLEKIKQSFSETIKVFKYIDIDKYKYFFLLFLLFSVSIIYRTIIIPPLGWDTITYHGPKAVAWVQSGSLSNFLNAPGGPTYANNLFGGGEIFSAWAMIIFNSDYAVGIVDAIMWVNLGLSIFFLAYLFIGKYEKALIIVVFVLFLPAVWLSVGSGYIELTLWTFFTIGIFFFKIYLLKKDVPFMILSIVSLALGTNVKITLLPIYIFIIFCFLSIILVKKEELFKQLIGFGIAIILSFSVLIPWLIKSHLNTGYFISIPFEIFNYKLGNWDSFLQWYKVRDFSAFPGFSGELESLLTIFNDPRIVYTQLGFPSLVLLIIGLIYLIKEIKLRNFEMFFYLIISIIVFLVFFSSDFKTVRIFWANVSGRFLIPAVIILSIFAFKEINKNYKIERLLIFLLLLSTSIQVVNGFFYGWAKIEYKIFLFSIVILVAIVTLNFIFIKLLPKKNLIKILIIFNFIFLLVFVNLLLNARDKYRDKLIQNSMVLHPIPSFWAQASEFVDAPLQSYNISVTAGPNQNLDNWFIFFFYGRNFQNKLFYVSPTIKNDVVFYKTNDELKKISDYNMWYNRLLENQIDFILCLPPQSLEYLWCMENPTFFKKIDFLYTDSDWSLFSIIKRY